VTSPRRAWVSQVREQATKENWSLWQATQAMYARAQQLNLPVSWLAAQRLARGWTQEQAVGEFADMCEEHQLGECHLTPQLLCTWERGNATPSADYLDKLCRLYQASATRLGYGGPDYTNGSAAEAQPSPMFSAPVSAAPPVPDAPLLPSPRDPRTSEEPLDQEPEEDDVARYTAWVRRVLGNAGAGLSTAALDAISATRQRIDDTIGVSRVHPTTVDQWERAAQHYSEMYHTISPISLLCDVLIDFTELRNLLKQPQSLASQQRLTLVAALFAAMAGGILVDLGSPREARAWHRTAGVPADESGDRALRAWVLAKEAYVPLYYGNPQTTIDLARQASLMAGNTPCVAAALAPALEARAHAQVGRVQETQAALDHAHTAYARLTPEDTNPANTFFGYTERLLHFHTSNALTNIRQTKRAYEHQERASVLYASTGEHIDPALLAMDRALCLVHDREIDQACQHASQTLLDLSKEYRSNTVLTRARAVAEAIPDKYRNTRPVRDFHEVLALDSTA